MTMTQCPRCGHRFFDTHSRGRTPHGPGWERRDYESYTAGARIAAEAGADWERRRPVRSATIESDVAVPVVQSAVSGLVGGVLAGAAAGLARVGNPWLVGLAGGGLALGAAWIVILSEHRAALWEIERIAGRDLDGDGQVGNPTPRPQEITRVEVSERDNGRRRIRYVDVPLSDGDLERLARAVLVRKARFSRRGLSDVLSQTEYAEVYQALTDGGLLVEIPGAGNELTAAGRAFLAQYAPAGAV